MERETIIYNGKKYHRYLKSKRRQLRVYFWRHDKWKAPPIALHRQIWIDNFGIIPKGMYIHHKDEKPLNNEISNLELITPRKHSNLHLQERPIKNIVCFCGKKFTTKTSHNNTKYCGRSCWAKEWRKKRKMLVYN